MVSTASSGKRSAAHSERLSNLRQNSLIGGGSERASIASGSLTGTAMVIPEGGDGTHLTPQQLGVMGESSFLL